VIFEELLEILSNICTLIRAIPDLCRQNFGAVIVYETGIG
jgi:hypothetical protein